ncbi:glycosyltransferase family 4 protein [Mycobacterium servetii]|uniref:Glycosyltransferase family 4 protein n=1 Tax=Mycobacterium servetii TaxID=3237418 RepID=A0ABV4C3T8_9MYCO
MIAADIWRRIGLWRHANEASGTKTDLPRILVISHRWELDGGAEFGFRDMVLALRKKRPDLDVVGVYPRKGSLARECEGYGIRTEITWVPWWAYYEQWRERVSSRLTQALVGALLVPLAEAIVVALLLPGILRAVWLLIRLRPTMVLTNTMGIPSHAIAAKLLGIPHYWMVCEFGKEDHQLRFFLGYRRTVRVIGRLSNMVICSSQAVEKSLLAVDPTMKTSVLYPAIDAAPATPPQRQPGERIRAVLVGRFSASKGQHLAVEAVAVARQAGVDIELTLVGAGDQEPVRELARRLGVADLVNIDGPTDDVDRYWSAAHVGLMCSECEAFGRVTVEAMRAGLPVCGTNAGGTPEIIDPGVNGLLSPAGDATALAANLMALESDEELRRSLGVRAVETAQRFERNRHDNELATVLDLC